MGRAVLTRAISLYEGGRYWTAKELLNDMIRRDDTLYEARLLLAMVCQALGDSEGEIAQLRQAIVMRPTDWRGVGNLAQAYMHNGQIGSALELFLQLNQAPTQGLSHSGVCRSIAHTTTCWSGALDHVARLLQVSDRCYLGMEIAAALCYWGAYDEAASCYETFLYSDHDNSVALVGRGLVEFARRQYASAFDYHARAHAANGSNAAAIYNCVIDLLALRDYSSARHLFQKNQLCVRRLWGHGQQSSGLLKPWTQHCRAGRRIAVHSPVGFGDTLQFVRFLGLVAANNDNVVLITRSELLSLLSHNFTNVSVIPRGVLVEGADYEAELREIFLLVDESCNITPSGYPYLTTNRVEGRPTVNAKSRPLRIGLCWRGRAGYQNCYFRRSLALDDLRPLAAVRNVEFYSLQVEPSDDELNVLSCVFGVKNVKAQDEQFTATASQIMTLDAVVSIDTAIAHLAGALGKPVCLLLPFSTSWRWASKASTKEWYPSITAFRQETPGVWATPVECVVNHVTRVAEAHLSV